MKIKYSVLVGILAAGVLAAPAMAGSTGAKSATKATVVDKSKDSSTSTIQGTLIQEGCWGGKMHFNFHTGKWENTGVQASWRSSDLEPITFASTYTNPESKELKDAIAQMAKNIKDLNEDAQDRGDRGTFYGYNTSGGFDKDKSSTKEDPNNLAGYDSAHKSITRYDNRTYKWVDAGADGSAMLIGDSDYMDGALATSADGTGKAGRYLTVSGNYGADVVVRIEGYGRVSPIILDLDGDGKIEASNGKYMPHSADVTKSKHAVMFDFYGNGFPVVMEWVGSNDGLLCRPHKDGSIDGTCLFGVANGHDNGYEEMSALDIDRNGSLEGAELEGLMIWTDKNCNGAADQGEVVSLESLGITSIGVTHNNYVGNFVRNGKSFKTFDWWPCVIDCRRVNLKKI